ncbi:MAG TPA: 16S rRNA (adenine(1518)-N(6)/adenine(1519)-N(6))-dimethyltransferase RsmA [Acidimicrobiia bacterium]|jgi:16S rRNA (adenine1518-N6/adenine1519-N6)-dimethyltransferase|nr:16S rRNA (adenine(1518)-N(6)/adenine(1519)-N(6))-dimethyltransferase RsmA [Acidimicrobiia bacterium]
MSTRTRRGVKALLDRHGLKPKTSLGQHFLVDPNVIDRVVRTAMVQPGDRVLEVGPGTGTLTRALWAAGAEVVAVEVDRRLAPLLEEELADSTIQVIYADAIDVDYNELLGRPPWMVVANLPYQVGTGLLLDWLRFVPALTKFTVMVQEEVGERLVARAGEAAYGLPSVVTALHAEARIAFKVGPQVFFPIPRVQSVVVTLNRRPAHALSERAIELAAAGFGQRRKMLRGSLTSKLDDPVSVLENAGFDPRLRAEQLSPSDFLRLAEAS